MARLKSLRGKLAMLCPETDGLQAKHRIRYELEDKNQVVKMEDIWDIEVGIVLPGIVRGQYTATQRIARIISLIYSIGSFTQEEVYQLLCSKRFRNREFNDDCNM